MTKLVIFGTGDIARLAHLYFMRDSQHEVTAFTVDRTYCKTAEFLGLPVVPFEDLTKVFAPAEYAMFVAVSYARMNRLRAEKCEQAQELGYRLASYVSSRATVLTDAPLGDNCFVLEGAVIQPYVRIGNDVTIWSGAHVGHDSVVEDHCFLAPCAALSGNVRVGAYCFLGVNATVRNSVTLAPGTLVGAGAVIQADTEPQRVYASPRAEVLSKDSWEVNP